MILLIIIEVLIIQNYSKVTKERLFKRIKSMRSL